MSDMTKIKIGLKLGPSVTSDHIHQTRDIVDFYELYAQIGCGYDELQNFDKPIVLHIPHSSDGTNFANPEKRDINLRTLEHVLRLAEKFNVKKLVFHPELYENEACTIDSLVTFVRENYDPRLHVENMPYNSLGVLHMGSSVDEIERIMREANVKFCLDLAHATEYLTYKNMDLQKIDDYVKLGPSHYHVTDTDLSLVFDPNFDETHLNIGEGNMNFSDTLAHLPDGAELTLETPMNASKNIDEISLIKSWL